MSLMSHIRDTCSQNVSLMIHIRGMDHLRASVVTHITDAEIYDEVKTHMLLGNLL